MDEIKSLADNLVSHMAATLQSPRHACAGTEVGILRDPVVLETKLNSVRKSHQRIRDNADRARPPPLF